MNGWEGAGWPAQYVAHRSPHASIAQATMHVWCPFFRLERTEDCRALFDQSWLY